MLYENFFCRFAHFQSLIIVTTVHSFHSWAEQGASLLSIWCLLRIYLTRNVGYYEVIQTLYFPTWRVLGLPHCSFHCFSRQRWIILTMQNGIASLVLLHLLLLPCIPLQEQIWTPPVFLSMPFPSIIMLDSFGLAIVHSIQTIFLMKKDLFSSRINMYKDLWRSTWPERATIQFHTYQISYHVQGEKLPKLSKSIHFQQ